MNFIQWKYAPQSRNKWDTPTEVLASKPCISAYSDYPEKTLLIPVTVNFEVDSIRIKDSFLYNFYCDNYYEFASKLIQDWDFSGREEYLDQVVETIKNTCDLYKYATREDNFDESMPSIQKLEHELVNEGDIIVDVQDSIPLYTSYKLPLQSVTGDSLIGDNSTVAETAQDNTKLNEENTGQSLVDAATILLDVHKNIPDQNRVGNVSNVDHDNPEKVISDTGDVNGFIPDKTRVTFQEQVTDSDMPFFPNGVRNRAELGVKQKISYDDIRIVIKLDLHVGSLYLRDQFEWELFGDEANVEHFARGLCADLGISGEFLPLISTSIRTQIIEARLDFSQSTQAMDFDRPFREEDDDEWEPDVRFLDEEEIAIRAKEEERNSRRMRRTRPNTAIREMTELPRLDTYPTHFKQHTPILVDMSVDLTDTAAEVYQKIQNEIVENRVIKRGCEYQSWSCDWCMIPGYMTEFIRRVGGFEFCDSCGVEFSSTGELGRKVREFRDMLGEKNDDEAVN